MRIHNRFTYQDGSDRMILDYSWHSSTPLDKVIIGDILRVKNKDSFETVDWEVTEPSIALNPEEAKFEWEKFPFGNYDKAKKYGFFPYVFRNLKKIKEYPPEKPSPRFIKSEIRKKVWIRDDGMCKKCGSKDELEFDHIIPVSKGGNNTINNIELLCKSCNREKSARIE